MDFAAIRHDIAAALHPHAGEHGRVATYIPALARVPAGRFGIALRIGLPCRSGVGGGIVAVVPDRLTLAVWSPALDASGNSWLGMKALETFVARTGLSVF